MQPFNLETLNCNCQIEQVEDQLKTTIYVFLITHYNLSRPCGYPLKFAVLSKDKLAQTNITVQYSLLENFIGNSSIAARFSYIILLMFYGFFKNHLNTHVMIFNNFK